MFPPIKYSFLAYYQSIDAEYVLEDGNHAKTEVEIDDRDSDSELENGDLLDREDDLYAMGHLDRYTCYGKSQSKILCTLSSNRVLQTRTYESETFPSARFFLYPEGFITKHVDFFTRCPYVG